MRYLLFFFIFSIVFSCKSDRTPNVSNVEVEWEFVPFHQFQLEVDDIKLDLPKVQREYPTFTNLFYNSILPLPVESRSEWEDILFDTSFVALMDTCSQIFNDWETGMKRDFDQAFKYYAHYTNDYDVPNVYTYVSGFAYQNFIFQDGKKDGLGVGLDMYIGKGFNYKAIDPRNPTFSQFLTQYFDKKYLVRKSLLSWLDDKIPTAQTGQLLDIIVRNGKIFYILDKILPDDEDDVILEMQPSEVEWVNFNEPELWKFLLKNDLIYSDDFSKINKLVNPSPNVPGLPPEASGGIANYIGWRIVQDYMVRSGTTMKELISESDFQKIFQESKYRPRERKG